MGFFRGCSSGCAYFCHILSTLLPRPPFPPEYPCVPAFPAVCRSREVCILCHLINNINYLKIFLICMYNVHTHVNVGPFIPLPSSSRMIRMWMGRRLDILYRQSRTVSKLSQGAARFSPTAILLIIYKDFHIYAIFA